MDWMYWLGAPAVSSLVGILFLWWRDRRQVARARRDPMGRHQALLAALEGVTPRRAATLDRLTPNVEIVDR